MMRERKCRGLNDILPLTPADYRMPSPSLTANVTDRAGALEMFEKTKENLGLVKKVLADGGYSRRRWLCAGS